MSATNIFPPWVEAILNSARNAVNVQVSGIAQGTLTDRSGSITTGGTKQTLAAANSGRKYLVIQNPSTAAGQNISAAESLWFNFTTDAVVGEPSFELPAGASFVMESSFVSTELISVIAATTGHKWTAKEA